MDQVRAAGQCQLECAVRGDCQARVNAQGLLAHVDCVLQLQKGKYVRDHSRLEVQPTGRYFLNMMLGEWAGSQLTEGATQPLTG